MTNQEIEAMVRGLEDLKSQKTKLENLIKQSEEALKKEMETRCMDEILTESGVKVRYISYAKEALDSKDLKAKMPEIFKQFLKVSMIKRFSYTA